MAAASAEVNAMRGEREWGMIMDFRVVGEGFQFPEGPIAFPDGSVVFVEILGGTLTRVWGDGKSEVIAKVGGGPNGAAIGPDGACYITNSGGFDWERGADGGLIVHGPQPRETSPGRVERVDLATGRFERIYTGCDGQPFSAPNDLVFDADGGFWFTDLGHTFARHRDRSALYYARPDGSQIVAAHPGVLSYNGVGLSPDQKTLYAADTLSARLWAYELEAPGRIRGPAEGRRLVGTAPGDVMLDSLAVTEAGNVCVGALLQGGLTTFRPDGSTTHVPLPDPYVTNVCFGGDDRRTAFATLSITGRVVAMDWPEPGLKLNFGV